MSLVEYVLRRPYTVVSMLILVCLLGAGAAMRMPVDIFPEIDIPVVSVVWTYSGMSATDMQNRILTLHQTKRELADSVLEADDGAVAAVPMAHELIALMRGDDPA